METITTTQSLRDTLTLLKRSKTVFKKEEKPNGDVFWNSVYIQPLGERKLMLNMKKEI